MAFPRYAPNFDHERDISLLRKQLQDDINKNLQMAADATIRKNNAESVINSLKMSLMDVHYKSKRIEPNISFLLSGIPIQINLLFDEKYTNATNIPVFLELKRTELLKGICFPMHIIMTKYIIAKCTEAGKKLFSYIINNINLYELEQWNSSELKIVSKEAIFKTVCIGNLTHKVKVNYQYHQTFYIPTSLHVDHTCMLEFNDSDRYLIFCALMHIKQWHHYTENRKMDNLRKSSNNKIIDMLDSIYED